MHPPDDPATTPATSHDTALHDPGQWSGPTYYGRPQLKEAPFNTWVVGGYVALAGLSGTAALIAAIADAVGGEDARHTVRHGRHLSLLAPVIGSALLIWDLHTPKRFYNMLRIARGTSPMSVGTWLLMSFSVSAFATAALQLAADRRPAGRWARGMARLTQVPAAIAGLGISTYTAALLSATSTPLWAAAPRLLAVRFAASSMTAGAAALSLLERSGPRRRQLDRIALAALAAKLSAGTLSQQVYQSRGVAQALAGGWGLAERIGGTGFGTALPIALHGLSLMDHRGRPGRLSNVASVAMILGSYLLRVSMMEAGNVSASRPDISFWFSQPDNLPH